MGNKNSRKPVEISPIMLERLKIETEFSEREIRDWYVGFHEDCPQGELTKEIFIDIFKKYYLRDKRADVFCEYVFELVAEMKKASMTNEANNTTNEETIEPIKTITFEQFFRAMACSTQSKNIEKRLKIAFDMYDASGNGELDLHELANLILAMYDLLHVTERTGENDPKRCADLIINLLDVDSKDGKLSKKEFVEGCMKNEKLRDVLLPKP